MSIIRILLALVIYISFMLSVSNACSSNKCLSMIASFNAPCAACQGLGADQCCANYCQAVVAGGC